MGTGADPAECRLPAGGGWRAGGAGAVDLPGLLAEAGADAECFTEDGWFRTGDIAGIDHDGFLSITDRKKELLKTSSGKLIAPQPIENQLKADMLVAQAATVGDKHKFRERADLAELRRAGGVGAAARRGLRPEDAGGPAGTGCATRRCTRLIAQSWPR